MGRMLRRYPNADAAWPRVERVRQAIDHLKAARGLLAESGRAKRAARRAIKSAEGAERHAQRVYLTLYYDERRKVGTA